MKISQKEQSDNNEKQLKVIENLKTEIQVRAGSLTKVMYWKYTSLIKLSFKGFESGPRRAGEELPLPFVPKRGFNNND